MIETIAFICASPGRFIHRENCGLMSVAIPIPRIIIPMIAITIVLILFNTDLF